MQHLFYPEGAAALAGALRRQPLLAFDFDGTLTPTIARPGHAHLSQAVSSRLAALSARLPVAIVTGRTVDDVRGRLGFEPRYIVGNHGAEEDGAPIAPRAPQDALSQLLLRLQRAAAELATAGVTVEDKGLSLALHYRLSRTREQALALIDRLLGGHDPSLRVFGGKLAVNITPRQNPDKADAVHRLVRRSGSPCAIFAGDDCNDEPVFERAPPDWLTIRVGRDNRCSKAQFFLDSPGEIAMLLERMVTLTSAR
jgi:trehalose 6-phosphate phosphatase